MQYTQMIRTVTGPYNLNTYFLICRKTRKTIIIDPGGPARDMIAFVREQNLLPEKIVNTHGHADQFFSTKEFKKTHAIHNCLHSADDLFFKDPMVREKTRKAVGLPAPYPADIKLDDKDEITFGKASLTVIHTPGHTPGSVCLLCESHLYTGDAIFVGEAGRTDLPGGDLVQLIDSIKTKIMPLNKETIIHPGHHHTGEAAQSTIAKEIKQNIYITDFILDE